ncbi:Valine--tRNA ligase, mitochondrial [Leucoagaricus sp. SymC.cos]|nr:Valine--tRNA ligase, mitochondrial [Leucoagaricus sp. SymC.cos]
MALTKGCKSAQVVHSTSEILKGCGASIVTPTITVHTLVRGLVDLDVEIGKCDKKLNLARLNLAKVVKAENVPDYVGVVLENVRLVNEEKHMMIEVEVMTLEVLKEMISKLK